MSLNAIFGLIIIACWLVFLAYWLVSAMSASPYARRNNMQWGVRFFVAVIILVLLQFRGTTRLIAYGPLSPVLGGCGVALCVLGIALAIWARAYLGRNWGMPMTLKQDPELVTTGPYAYVRHPIYTGMLLAMLGSALAVSLLWLVALVCLGGYFIYSAVQEQKIMLEEFPDAYPAYMSRTKMLIPFLL